MDVHKIKTIGTIATDRWFSGSPNLRTRVVRLGNHLFITKWLHASSCLNYELNQILVDLFKSYIWKAFLKGWEWELTITFKLGRKRIYDVLCHKNETLQCLTFPSHLVTGIFLHPKTPLHSSHIFALVFSL